MANFGKLSLTFDGMNMQYRAQAGIPLKFKRFGLGSGAFTGGLNISAMKKLIKEEVSVDIAKGYMQNGAFVVEGFFSNDGLNKGFAWREIGVFVDDGNGGEILYCYANAGGSYDFIPATADERYSKYIRLVTAIGNATDVSIVESEGIIYTDRRTYDAQVAEFKEDIDSLQPSKRKGGKAILIEDSAAVPFLGLNLYGKSEQASATGKNLLRNELYNLTTNGLTFTVNSDKTVTVNGTATVSTFLTLSSSFDQPAGSYILSGCPSSGGTDLYLLYMTADGFYAQDAGKGGSTFTISDDVKPMVRLAIYEGATLNNVVFSPMIRQASITDDTYEPYTGEKPSPSTDFPQEIVCIGDNGSIEIDVYGKNILPNMMGSMTYNGLTVTVNEDKSITISGTPSQSTFFGLANGIRIPAGEYILSGCPSGGSGSTHMLYIVENGRYVQDSGYGSRFIYPEDRVVDVRIAIYAGTPLTNLTFKPMIRCADIEDDSYEPYKKQSFVVGTANGLCGIPVSKGGNYTDENGQEWICDEVDLERGVYIHRVARKVFDGTEDSWRQYADKLLYMVDWSEVNGGWEQRRAIASHFINDHNKAYSAENGYFAIDHKGLCYFASEKETLDDFKAWLAENNITVYCPLIAPIETPLVYAEIAPYRAMTANNPWTAIFNDVGAGMSAEYVTKSHEAIYNGALRRANRMSAQKANGKTVTLSTGSNTWDSQIMPGHIMQKIAFEGMTADATVICSVAPDKAMEDEVSRCMVRCVGQTEGYLWFEALNGTAPTIDIAMNILVVGV